MTKRYAILQKKLHELEHQLLHVFSSSSGDTHCHQLLSDAIQQRLAFLNNLLAAEIGSHPSNPRHLRHISARLAAMDAAFRHWDDNSHHHHEGDESRVSLAAGDAGSNCSCTDSCLNDDADDAAEGFLEERAVVVAAAAEEEMEEIRVIKEEEEEDKREEEVIRKKKKKKKKQHSGGLMVVLMGFVITILIRLFSGLMIPNYIHHYHGGVFLTPT